MSSSKKQLIGTHNVNDFIEEGKTVILGQGMILTPGAKDILRNKGISICYEKSVVDSKAEQKTLKSIAKKNGADKEIAALAVRLLRDEYGITQPAELQRISVLVLQRLCDMER